MVHTALTNELADVNHTIFVLNSELLHAGNIPSFCKFFVHRFASFDQHQIPNIPMCAFFVRVCTCNYHRSAIKTRDATRSEAKSPRSMALQCLLLFVCIGSVRAGLGVFDHGFYDSNATGLQLAAGCCKLSPEAQTLVTVTVPTCGRVAFSRVTLDMIAAQDYPNIEVLFVDDGKPGSLVSALREEYDVEVHSQIEGGESNTYKATGPLRRANGLSVVVLELGRGPSLSIGEKRYAAAQRARGSVLVHWDDDDLFPPERVRLQALPILAGKTQVTVLGHSFFGDLPVGKVYSSYTNPIFLGSLAYSREIALNLGFADVSLYTLGGSILCRPRGRGLQPAVSGARR